MLRQPDAWDSLDEETQVKLWDMLPAPPEGEDKPHHSQHPLGSEYRFHIETALRRWQADLQDGREAKGWRKEATEAVRERAEGKFNDWQAEQREMTWGRVGDVEGGKGRGEGGDPSG